MDNSAKPWMVSLHGGHSGKYCEHARGSLHDILTAAVAAGFHTYGVSEHAPRIERRFLYDAEIEKGWNVERLRSDFEAYARDLPSLVEEFAGRLEVLRGFEAEVVPGDGYVRLVRDIKMRHRFDYMVGSVHHVGEILIDGETKYFEKALELYGSMEELALNYYKALAKMILSLRPELVGHFDLIAKNGMQYGFEENERVNKAADVALKVVKDCGCIIDLNSAGYRKGLGRPYPSPRIVRRAAEMGIPFCFGDDSHSPEDVGRDMEPARKYLLDNGVMTITYLAREGGAVVRRVAELG